MSSNKPVKGGSGEKKLKSPKRQTKLDVPKGFAKFILQFRDAHPDWSVMEVAIQGALEWIRIHNTGNMSQEKRLSTKKKVKRLQSKGKEPKST